MSRIASSFQGKKAEYEVVCALLKRNYNVWFPAMEATIVDLIANKEGLQPVTIQVKSTLSKQRPHSRFYRVELRSSGGRGQRVTDKVDVYIMVSPDGMFLMLSSDLIGRTNITLDRNNKSFENWSLIDQISEYKTDAINRQATNKNKRKRLRKVNE